MIKLLLVLFIFMSEDIQAYTLSSEVYRTIKENSIAKGLQPRLVYAIIMVESNGDKNAIGKNGEVGLMQVRKKFFPKVTFDIENNIDIGTTYLRALKELCSHWGDAWFVSYNYGPSAKLMAPNKTQYYKKVMAVMNGKN